MSNGKLILHPAEPAAAPTSLPRLIKSLQEIGFLATPFSEPPLTRFLVGRRFLQLITFLGCSPQIQLEPGSNGSEAFCHVDFSGPSDRIRFASGSNTVAPACPACGSKNREWRQMVAAWKNARGHYRWNCGSCATASDLTKLNWRQSAGFSRFFLEVRQVFPGEAVPGDELMRVLQSSTQTEWAYFYVLL